MIRKAFVLAGGMSRRFGRDKALTRIGGISLIEKSTALARRMNLEPTVLTRDGRDYAFSNCRVEKDLVPDKGPLGGIYTACILCPGAPFLVLTCDMPHLIPEVLDRLLKAHHPTDPATVFESHHDRMNPFPGVYDPSLAERSRELMDANDLSLQGFLKGLHRVRVIPSVWDEQIFRNVNEPRDLVEVWNEE